MTITSPRSQGWEMAGPGCPPRQPSSGAQGRHPAPLRGLGAAPRPPWGSGLASLPVWPILSQRPAGFRATVVSDRLSSLGLAGLCWKVWFPRVKPGSSARSKREERH